MDQEKDHLMFVHFGRSRSEVGILAEVGHLDFHVRHIDNLHTPHSIHITYARNRKSGSMVVCFPNKVRQYENLRIFLRSP